MTTPPNVAYDTLEGLFKYHIENEIDIPLHISCDTGDWVVTYNLTGTNPGTATNFKYIAIVPFTSVELSEAWYVYSGQGGSGAAFTINSSDSGTDPDSGTAMTASCDCATAGLTNDVNSISILSAAKSATKGQIIGLEDAGTVTGLDYLCVTLKFKVTQR